MNKFILRKHLREMRRLRQNVDIWPDGAPYCRTSAADSLSPEPPAAVGFEGPLPSLNRLHKICMMTAFLPPEDQVEVVIEIARQELKSELSLRFIADYLLQCQPMFDQIRFRLARAVQPTGKEIDPLAATIGAIRLHDKYCAANAGAHLSAVIIEAFQANDKKTLSRVQKFATAGVGNHRNFQIWLAIEEVIRAQTKTGSKVPHCSSMPTTSDVRRYVAKNTLTFDKLPGSKNHKGWTRLWKDSGASTCIPKGVRDKKG